MRSVNANPGKYVSIITNFGCHYTCPECIVRNNGLKMSETDNFSTQEPLNKVLCKERPEWVSVSGGGDPLFHWKEHWSFYEGLFHTAERRNVKLEMHTSYLPDSPEVQDFPLNWFERVVYHVHKFDDLLHVKRKFGEIVRVVFVVDDNSKGQRRGLASRCSTGGGRRSGLLSCQMLSWCRLLLVLIHPGGVVGMGCFVERCSPCKVSA